MKLRRFSLRTLAALLAPMPVMPALASIENAKTPEEAVAELQKEFNEMETGGVSEATVADARKQVDTLAANTAKNEKKIAELNGEAKAAKEKEQSGANKMLGGLTMAATGIGGMQLAQGLAEKQADEEGAADMKAYLDTIKCGIGGDNRVKYNETGLAPAETTQFGDVKLEYATLAKKMKTAKESLGLAPGIESELVMDADGLYDNSGTDAGGISHHFDTATQRADSNSGRNRAIAGGAIAGVGVVGGVVGNAVINKKDGDKDEGKNGKDVKLDKDVIATIMNKEGMDAFSGDSAASTLSQVPSFMQMSKSQQIDHVNGLDLDALKGL